jgi:hypothetical protein
MSAIPYVACASFTAVLGVVSEKIVQKGILSRRNTRRIFNSIGFYIKISLKINENSLFRMSKKIFSTRKRYVSANDFHCMFKFCKMLNTIFGSIFFDDWFSLQVSF